MIKNKIKNKKQKKKNEMKYENTENERESISDNSYSQLLFY